MATGAPKVLGNHEAGIKCMEYVKATGQVVTGSWDKSVKLWDARAPTSLVSTLSQPDKVFTLDLSEHKLIVGTAGRHVVSGRLFVVLAVLLASLISPSDWPVPTADIRLAQRGRTGAAKRVVLEVPDSLHPLLRG